MILFALVSLFESHFLNWYVCVYYVYMYIDIYFVFVQELESRLVDKLRKELLILTDENLSLKQQIKTQQNEPNAPVTSKGELIESSSSNRSSGCLIEEERLKWQMEMENLRRELNSSFNSDKEKLTAEKISMQAELKLLLEKVTKLEFQSESRNREYELEQKLTHSEKRYPLQILL